MSRKAGSVFILLAVLVVSGSSTNCNNDDFAFIQENYRIYRDNIGAVNTGLKECSKIPDYLDQILLTIQTQTLTGDLILDISNSIRYLTIDKLSSGNITIMLPEELATIERLELRSQDNWFLLNKESDFFSKLPNLEHLDAERIVLQKLPSFSEKHSKLTRIQVHNSTFSPATNSNSVVDVDVTHTFVSSLANLVLLSWKNSAILSLSQDAFKGLIKLTELNLEGNMIKEINSNQFAKLVSLKELDLSHNELTTIGVPNDAFANLTNIESLHINSNPQFAPSLVFHPMFNLQNIYLQNNKYESLDFRAFQQKRNLAEIHLFGDNMFRCVCDTTEWMYIVSANYSIAFYGGECDTPITAEGKPVTDPVVYNECPKEITYDCFGEVNCTTEQLCVNTFNGYECECVGGFDKVTNEVTKVEECIDTDECNETKTGIKVCDQICINQVGSYFCACEEGYTLSGMRNCSDIDECGLKTDNCTEDGIRNNDICENIDGGYKCNCKPGFEIQSETNCKDLDECASDELNSCLQLCNNKQGNYVCSCFSGFEFNSTTITILNGTMDNSNSTMDNSSSTMDNSTSTMDNNNSTMDNSNNINSTVDPSKVVDLVGNKGIPCVDVDECAVENGQCEQNCTNTIGSYNCSCIEGFNLTSRFRCSDIDECAINTTLCDANKGLRCNNTVGSYECICKKSYIIDTATNTSCIFIPSSLTLEELAGIGVSGFVILSFVIIVLIVTLCTICRKCRRSGKNKTQKEALLESARVSEVPRKEKEKEEGKGETKETMDVNKNAVYNPYESAFKSDENEYETLDNVRKEETIVYGTVVDNSILSDSMDKQLMEREFTAVGERVEGENREASLSPEAMNNEGYRDVLV